VSRFLGRLSMAVATGPDSRPVATADGRALWDLTDNLAYETGDGEMITAPAGFRTDLGSIPQLAWSLGFSPDGEGAPAFVIHDLLYFTAGSGMVRGKLCITRERPYTRAEADGVLRAALADCGVSLIRRNAMYQAVRLGGAAGWGR
jgi:hypothetical protein